jgi:hypothetical protein
MEMELDFWKNTAPSGITPLGINKSGCATRQTESVRKKEVAPSATPLRINDWTLGVNLS